jgi:hypothetical protein
VQPVDRDRLGYWQQLNPGRVTSGRGARARDARANVSE